MLDEFSSCERGERWVYDVKLCLETGMEGFVVYDRVAEEEYGEFCVTVCCMLMVMGVAVGGGVRRYRSHGTRGGENVVCRIPN